MELMKKCFKDEKQVRKLLAEVGPHDDRNAFIFALQRSDKDMINFMLNPTSKLKKGETPDTARARIYTSRKPLDKILLNEVTTGSVSNMAYGAKVRKVQMGRGNR